MDDDYPLPTISEARFPELLEIMKGEDSFPPTYARWQALWEVRRKQEEGSGFNIQFIDVQPSGFANFCKTRELPANWHSLILYTRAKAGR
jgi:hypothetical protein